MSFQLAGGQAGPSEAEAGQPGQDDEKMAGHRNLPSRIHGLLQTKLENPRNSRQQRDGCGFMRDVWLGRRTTEKDCLDYLDAASCQAITGVLPWPGVQGPDVRQHQSN